MTIELTNSERTILQRAQQATRQTIEIPKGQIGDMTIANRLRGFGWLERLEPRSFRLTPDGAYALATGVVAKPFKNPS